MGKRSEFDETKWDAQFREYRKVRMQIRRLTTLGVKAGKPWDAPTTIGEIAKASKKSAAEVILLIESCAYLVLINQDDGPVENWTVFEDGE